ncbi:MAG: hypothetical protein ABIE84_03575 [bacterium]
MTQIDKPMTPPQFRPETVGQSIKVTTDPTENTHAASFMSVLFKKVNRAEKKSPSDGVGAVTRNNRPEIVSLKSITRLKVPNLLQGHNESGPTALAMCLANLGINNVDQHTLFPSSTFSHDLGKLKSKAEEYGLIVRIQNNGSLEDLDKAVKNGIAPIVLGTHYGREPVTNQLDGNYVMEYGESSDWMTVTGTECDESGQVTYVYCNVPNRSKPQRWSANDFRDNYWQKNIIPGGNCTYLAIARKPREGDEFKISQGYNYLTKDFKEDRVTGEFLHNVNRIKAWSKAIYFGEKSANDIASALINAAQATRTLINAV